MQPVKIWLIFEINTGYIGKSIRPNKADVPDFISVYENGGQSDYRRISHTAGSPDFGVFNGIYHIITWNRHYIINNSKYLHLFCWFVFICFGVYY